MRLKSKPFDFMAQIQTSSLVKVAREAGVALSTASLAMRGSPLVKAATAERVKAVAERLGYRADLRMGSLMARIRRAKGAPDRERLAFVWVSATRADTRREGFCQASLAGAKRRAEELGCALDEFWLHDGGMTEARLEKILVTRGITGVVFSAPLRDMEVTVDWNWGCFAAAIIGNSEFHPSLHRAGHYHYRSMWTAMEKLRLAGCLRPAVVLHEPHHRRIHGVHQAAFLTNHPLPEQALGMTRFGLPASGAALRTWIAKVKADALIFVVTPPAEFSRELAGIKTLRSIVSLGASSTGMPGMDMREDLVAAGAVDLVVAQLHRNERGVPERPKTLLLEGEWRE
ncbi:LacI family DNA-binding transcriptional regulator [Rariglobus hedericola]|nr:LacI family DNA-binding transcriptional regulator [Rariglobus hedericola]